MQRNEKRTQTLDCIKLSPLNFHLIRMRQAIRNQFLSRLTFNKKEKRCKNNGGGEKNKRKCVYLPDLTQHHCFHPLVVWLTSRATHKEKSLCNVKRENEINITILKWKFENPHPNVPPTPNVRRIVDMQKHSTQFHRGYDCAYIIRRSASPPPKLVRHNFSSSSSFWYDKK